MFLSAIVARDKNIWDDVKFGFSEDEILRRERAQMCSELKLFKV